MRCVPNEGMPQYRNPFEKGRLIIAFDVRFPPSDWLGTTTPASTQKKVARLEKLLPPRQAEGAMVPDGAEECRMFEVDAEALGGGARRGGARSGEAYESDEDEGGMHGGQRVQCAQH